MTQPKLTDEVQNSIDTLGYAVVAIPVEGNAPQYMYTVNGSTKFKVDAITVLNTLPPEYLWDELKTALEAGHLPDAPFDSLNLAKAMDENNQPIKVKLVFKDVTDIEWLQHTIYQRTDTLDKVYQLFFENPNGGFPFEEGAEDPLQQMFFPNQLELIKAEQAAE